MTPAQGRRRVHGAYLTKQLSLKLTWFQSARSLLNIIDSVLDIAKAIPPVDNKLSRFGNPAFKTFFDKVQEVSGMAPCEQYTLG